MTGKIVDLQVWKVAKEPHLEGNAVCLECRYRWKAVIPTGAEHYFECARCGCMKGVFNAVCMPADGVVRICGDGCNNEFFLFLPSGYLMCALCGLQHTCDK